VCILKVVKFKKFALFEPTAGQWPRQAQPHMGAQQGNTGPSRLKIVRCADEGVFCGKFSEARSLELLSCVNVPKIGEVVLYTNVATKGTR
jgi:hypothetical protein